MTSMPIRFGDFEFEVSQPSDGTVHLDITLMTESDMGSIIGTKHQAFGLAMILLDAAYPDDAPDWRP